MGICEVHEIDRGVLIVAKDLETIRYRGIGNTLLRCLEQLGRCCVMASKLRSILISFSKT